MLILLNQQSPITGSGTMESYETGTNPGCHKALYFFRNLLEEQLSLYYARAREAIVGILSVSALILSLFT